MRAEWLSRIRWLWRATDVADSVTTPGTKCEAVDLTNLPGAASRQQRTYLLRDDTAAPQSFGVDEAEAVRETVALLKQADLAPLDVSGYGTLQERLAEGHDIPDEERALMDRALAENAVIVAQMTPFFDED